LKKYLLFSLIFCIGLVTFYALGMNQSLASKIYIPKFGNIKTIKGERFGSNDAFPMPADSNMIHWDAGYYKAIRDYAYKNPESDSSNNECFYAFFPAFPWIWKISHVGNVGVIILNALFFLFGSFFVLKALKFPSQYTLYFALPSVIIFFIPYSDALNFFFLGIAVLAWKSNRKLLLFLALFASALVRPSFTFLLLAFLINEVFQFLARPNLKTTLRNSIYLILPLLLATLTVGLIQIQCGSPSIWQFYHAQKIWGHELAWPTELKDWSTLGFGINLSILISLLIPLLVILTLKTIKLIRIRVKGLMADYTFEDQLFYTSAAYLVGIIGFVLFFRHGSLHCLFRFSLSTPFALVFLVLGMKRIQSVNILIRLSWLMGALAITTILLGRLQFSKEWKWDDLGFFLYFFVFAQVLLNKEIPARIKPILIGIALVFNWYWTAYLFNWYLNDGWIFA